MKAWIDGRLVDATDAGVALDDHGLTTGDGCFETLKVTGGVPFALTRHLRRLRRSCEGLGIPAPDEALVREGCAAVVDASGASEARLRITVTAGRTPLGSGRADNTPTVYVLTGPLPDWDATTAVAVCPWVRNERSPVAGLKTTSYVENVVALAWAKERGCSEALFANTRGELCEGTGTNVFVVLGDRLVTPPLDSGCLAGVTRELLLEIVDAEERAIPVEQLAEATEVFLTSTTREIQPVHEVDGRALDAPGPLTRQAVDAWRALVAGPPDP
jgi:branched-chain amino acid aminotransferase